MAAFTVLRRRHLRHLVRAADLLADRHLAQSGGRSLRRPVGLVAAAARLEQLSPGPAAISVFAVSHQYHHYCCAGRHRDNVQLGVCRVRVLASPLARSRRRLLFDPRYVDDSELGDAGTPLYPFQQDGLVGYLQAPDRPRLLRRSLFHLPPAAILPSPAPGARRRRAGRRRITSARLSPDHAPTLAPSTGRGCAL